MKMPGRAVDLNDLLYFAWVVEHGGFSQAGRALNVPKSKLSRRVALLEERLGVRLIQRSTRRFSTTEAAKTTSGIARPCWWRPLLQRRLLN